jgi:hypothetical protein
MKFSPPSGPQSPADFLLIEIGLKNSSRVDVLKGQGFIRAAKPNKNTGFSH